MSKIFAGNFRYRNWKRFKWKELIFTIEYCSFLLKSLSLSFTLYVPKNTIIWTINESAKDDRKLGDYAYEEVDVEYIFLKGNVKKCSNYVWKKSFITWIFLSILWELNFPILLKNAKLRNSPPSKISDIEELSSNSDCVTLIWVGFLGASLCDSGKYVCVSFAQYLKIGAR